MSPRSVFTRAVVRASCGDVVDLNETIASRSPSGAARTLSAATLSTAASVATTWRR